VSILEPTLLEKMKAGIVNLTTRKQQPGYDHTAPLATYGKIANMSEPTFQEYSTLLGQQLFDRY
jgi:hypothetical protein